MSDPELTQRCQAVLRLVVREHIRTAAPVSSKAISEGYNLGVSSATVRNEMAALEERGYLTHPHTSAGRIPTERGYRYFVEKLMGESQLSPTERRTISHQFHQARLELDQWMRLSAAVLAHNAQGASLVTAPKSLKCRLKHLELISIRDEVVLLILVLQEGTVKQQILSLDAPVTQDELAPIARHLTHLWSGCDHTELSATCGSLVSFEGQVADVVLDIMQRLDTRTSSEIYRDGLLNVLNQSETAQSDSAQQILRALEGRQFVEGMVSDVMQHGGLQIIIGGEGRWEELSEVSVVLTRYGIDDKATGALGVLGPIRMQYGRVVSVVRYVSQLMSDLITDLYGQ
ncbi:MAG: heat-inducible transcription repressor HrcA [Anaerolineales bacterium]|nr:MAG: heat-inducible transcription repressor HrcA [Anaerolineales bacterium]